MVIRVDTISSPLNLSYNTFTPLLPFFVDEDKKYSLFRILKYCGIVYAITDFTRSTASARLSLG